MCQIFIYTGHSAKYCRQRQQKSTPFGQNLYDRESPGANKNQRREIKGIMKEAPKLHHMTAEDEDAEQYEHESENS